VTFQALICQAFLVEWRVFQLKLPIGRPIGSIDPVDFDKYLGQHKTENYVPPQLFMKPTDYRNRVPDPPPPPKRRPAPSCTISVNPENSESSTDIVYSQTDRNIDSITGFDVNTGSEEVDNILKVIRDKSGGRKIDNITVLNVKIKWY
jgi:hypothetical protein